MRISEILHWLTTEGYKYSFVGDEQTEVSEFSSLLRYRNGSITWIKSAEKYDEYIKMKGGSVQLSCAVVQRGIGINTGNMIISENSKDVFFSILSHFFGKPQQQGLIGEGTVISGDVKYDETVSVGCNCSIVGDIEIGDHTLIEHNVVIQGRVRIGRECHIQSGTVIGIDGYGYSENEVTKKKTMIEHFGGVLIGDRVFIGSHSNIARGTIDNTIIGDGVKIAPSTHIGHNSSIGEDTAIICSTIYGSTVIGDRSYITDSTISNQISVGNDTVIGMGSLVTKSIVDDVIAYGIPARVVRENDGKY